MGRTPNKKQEQTVKANFQIVQKQNKEPPYLFGTIGA
jgi:hypothetical protein